MPGSTLSSALGCAAFLLAVVAPNALAQAYPQRAITLVNPNAAGGSNEVIKGVIFDRLATALGVPIVMESRSGASGTIGAAYVARAEPDGYTLLIAGASIMATNAVTKQALPYDPVRDLTPIIVLVNAELALVVNRNVPASSVREFVDLARAQPGRLDYGSYGLGSTSFFAFELFKSVAGIDVLHVPYRGSAPLLAALLAGEVDASFDFLPPIAPHAASGALRILGIAAPSRSTLMPDVPTLAEQGFPVEAGGALMLVGPSGMPPRVVERLNVELNAVLAQPDVRQRLAEIGYEVVGGTRERATKQVAADLAKWKALARTIGLVPQ